METSKTEDERPGAAGVAAWLRSSVTVTLPGWGIAAGMVTLLALVLVALD